MLKELLKNRNIVATSQRLEVLQCLHTNKTYLSAYDIERQLHDLDISTIYRALNLFEDSKLIVKKFDEEANAFTYKFISHQHYHHLKCVKCHKVIDIDFCPMNIFDQNIALQNDFLVTDYVFEIYGYCHDCQ